LAGTLYITGTPIGNLSDLSPRCAEILAQVDFIAAEDTRVTLKLLNHLGTKKSLLSYYEHNREKSGKRILERLLAGENCALVSDAGMPAVSDPGEELVRLCAEHGIEVIPIPGPTAFVAALAVSGLPTGRFTFEGFLSTARRSRFDHLEALRNETRTMIFYEAPHKLLRTLADMLAAWGDRQVSVSRELTKRFEETRRFSLSAALQHYEAHPPKGEFVLVIRGAEPEKAPAVSMEDALEMVAHLRSQGVSLKDASTEVSRGTGLSKNAIYAAALKQD